MKITAMFCAALFLASCHDGLPFNNSFVGVGGSPLAPIGTSLGLSNVVIQPLAPIIACPFVPAFTPTLSLVVTSGSSTSVLSFDTVTFRLIGGSSVGGPTVTFPKAGLTELFGTTSVVGTRTFVFTPTFSCPVTIVHTIAADVTLVDQTTSISKVISASANLP